MVRMVASSIGSLPATLLKPVYFIQDQDFAGGVIARDCAAKNFKLPPGKRRFSMVDRPVSSALSTEGHERGDASNTCSRSTA